MAVIHLSDFQMINVNSSRMKIVLFYSEVFYFYRPSPLKFPISLLTIELWNPFLTKIYDSLWDDFLWWPALGQKYKFEKCLREGKCLKFRKLMTTWQYQKSKWRFWSRVWLRCMCNIEQWHSFPSQAHCSLISRPGNHLPAVLSWWVQNVPSTWE